VSTMASVISTGSSKTAVAPSSSWAIAVWATSSKTGGLKLAIHPLNSRALLRLPPRLVSCCLFLLFVRIQQNKWLDPREGCCLCMWGETAVLSPASAYHLSIDSIALSGWLVQINVSTDCIYAIDSKLAYILK
jgi:hypothetical protein